MAEISQKEQLALHEFSVRYRAALAERHLTQEQSMDTVKDVVRDQYDQEMQVKRSSSIEPSTPAREHEPPEPEP